MAGGRGTRLWPLSSSVPKPLLPLLPEGRTFLEETAERISALAPPSQWILGAGTGAIEGLAHALRNKWDGFHSLEEPGPRDTAPALLYLAATLRNGAFGGCGDDIVLAVPVDQWMDRPDDWVSGVRKGVPLAEEGYLVTLGIKPTHPVPGYGYIKPDKSLGDGFGVLSFLEKPDVDEATTLIQDGCLWNSGTFLFKAEDMAKAAREIAPRLWEGILGVVGRSHRADKPGDAFLTLPKTSFDVVIAQSHPQVAVVPCNPGWRDLGTWEAVASFWEEGGTDPLAKQLVEVDSKGNLVHTPGKTVALVGVENLVVVEGPEGLLVCARSAAQRVKEAVSRLEKGSSPK